MDSGSIIYIVIAIALAIVNAVAQKKKKQAQQNQPAPRIPQMHEEYLDDEDVVPVARYSRQTGTSDYDPFALLYGKEDVENEVESEVVEPHAEVKLTDFQLKMNERAQLHINKKFENNISIAEFEEGSIASSEIGNAQTQEEEDLALSESQNFYVKDFDAKKAIVYSEIIRSKYFTI